MKKNATAVVLGLMVLLNLILLANTMALGKNIENLRSSMSSHLSQMQNDVRSISYNVSSTLERQASIFDGANWSFGALDPESMTILLVASVVPKEVHADTIATLTVNGISVPMTRDGVNFSGEIPVDLFNSLEAYITFESEGNQRSQRLSTDQWPFEDALLTLHAQNIGSSTFEHYNGKYTLNGKVDIDIRTPKSSAVTSLKIVTTDNDTLLQELTLKPAQQSQSVDYKVEIMFEANHIYETAVVATDSYGLTYRTIIDRKIIGADATSPDFGERDWWDEMVILDKNGVVLYDSSAEYH
ncbi:hypothetical protein ACS3UN_12655 [Oscillospiraceae bacterium LTW-04]|nr:hypothetical protein RBH76_00460 [Oscillospiraceae bacterium MB24-C1]